jgi:alanine racemase
LKDVAPEAEVISLLGPLDAAEYAHCVCERDIVAFVGSTEQLLLLEEAGRQAGTTVRVALKFDTGMARLGFGADEAAGVADTLHGLEHVRATMACSHLATADDPEQVEYAQEQAGRFARILGTLHARGLDVRASLANSGAIFGHPGLHHDLQRPGIALYGGNPFHGTAWEEKGHGLAAGHAGFKQACAGPDHSRPGKASATGARSPPLPGCVSASSLWATRTTIRADFRARRRCFFMAGGSRCWAGSACSSPPWI